jgi:FkbM family methyltransferase
MPAKQPHIGAGTHPVSRLEHHANGANLLAGLHKLRPAKVRNALRRRRFEYQIPRLDFHDAPGVLELGSTYGGWMVPGGLIEPSWICYCVGAGGDISFDLELIRRYGVRVRAFDAVDEYVRLAAEQGQAEPRFSAHQAAIATSDGPLRMQITHDPKSRSVSSAGLYESGDFVELPGRTLASLMAELGDERIDLLKLDIEGGEYQVLPTLDLRAMGVKVFATQLHHTGSVRDARGVITRLHEQGYEPVACCTVVKLTFVDRDLLSSRSTPSERG